MCTNSTSSVLLKCKCLLISFCLAVASINSSPLLAQGKDVDIAVPQIVDIQTGNGIPEEPQTFVVTVTDDQAVDTVTLFYRYGESGDFNPEPMKATNGAQYEVTIPAGNVNANSIQYLVRATDASGNSTFRGQVFAPLTAALNADITESTSENEVATTSITPKPETTQPVQPLPIEQSKSSNRTLYTVLGVLAAAVVVGAAAGGGSGSSSGGGGNDCSNEGCTLIFTTTAP